MKRSPKPQRFVVIMGIVSLFADVTNEGARSITGPFLAVLGAPAVVVSVVAGVGEFIVYTLRLGSGYFVDKTEKHGLLLFLGLSVMRSFKSWIAALRSQ